MLVHPYVSVLLLIAVTIKLTITDMHLTLTDAPKYPVIRYKEPLYPAFWNVAMEFDITVDGTTHSEVISATAVYAPTFSSLYSDVSSSPWSSTASLFVREEQVRDNNAGKRVCFGD